MLTHRIAAERQLLRIAHAFQLAIHPISELGRAEAIFRSAPKRRSARPDTSGRMWPSNSRWMRPLTATVEAPSATRRERSNSLGQMTTLVTPVSSSLA